MSVILVCDGCGKNSRCNATSSESPEGWIGLLMNGQAYDVCSEECGERLLKIDGPSQSSLVQTSVRTEDGTSFPYVTKSDDEPENRGAC